MKVRSIICCAVAALAVGAVSQAAVAATQYTKKDVELSFNPYLNGMPSYPGLKVGMTIDQSNVDQFKKILTPGIYTLVKKGWWKLPVRSTQNIKLTHFYIDATLKNLNKTSLAPAPSDNLVGYVAGRPFPGEPSKSDPRAGTKLAWNFQHGLSWGDDGTIDPFVFRYIDMKSGKQQRLVELEYHTLNLMHRVEFAPIPEIKPNPANIFRSIYIKVNAPSGLRNTQLLIQRYEDDSKQDTNYIYLGFQRRVRRLAAGQTTDAFLGSDLMIQDFEGFNDRVSSQKWTYLGTKDVLYPFYSHNLLPQHANYDGPGADKLKDGFKFVALGGKGGCFPQIKWQLRKVYVLQAQPVDKSSPISKRIIFVDAQTYKMLMTDIYDRDGKLWKVWTIGDTDSDHTLPSNKGTGIEIDDSFSMVDMEALHCTTGQFQGQVDPKLSPPHMFNLQYMRNQGTGD